MKMNLLATETAKPERSSDPSEQIKIFSKQKAQTQTKSKQSLSSSLDFKIFKIILKGDRYSLK